MMQTYTIEVTSYVDDRPSMGSEDWMIEIVAEDEDDAFAQAESQYPKAWNIEVKKVKKAGAKQ